MSKKRDKGQARKSSGGDSRDETWVRVEKIRAVNSVCNSFIRYGAFVGIAVCGYLSFDTLAGKTTEADVSVLVGVLVDLGKSDGTVRGVLGAISLLSMFLAWRWRGQHRAVVERLGKMREARESQLDPERSSSRLLPTGETRPEDVA